MISVIVPVYNVGKYLEKCVKSVKAQTDSDWELLLIDDGSTDNSGDICDKFAKEDERIKVFRKPNGGVSSARNLGIEKAHGDYIIFVDGDDFIEPTLFEDFKKINKEKDLDLFMFEYSVDYGDDVRIHSVADYWYGKNDTQTALINTITPNNRLIGVKIYRKALVGNKRFDKSIILGEDTMFAVDVITEAKNVFYSKKFYYHYVQSENSAVRSNFTTKKLSGLKAYENNINFCKKSGFEKATKYAVEAYVVLAIALAQKAIKDENYDEKEALSIIKKGIKKYGKQVLNSKFTSKKTKIKTLVAMISIRLCCKICDLLGEK